MANRMVSQARSLIASANQVLVPYYSKVAETTRGRIRDVYERNFETTLLLSTLVFCSLLPLLPTISKLWIGRLEPLFLFFSVVLVLGWFANVMATPAYFANLGGGWISRISGPTSLSLQGWPRLVLWEAYGEAPKASLSPIC